MAGDDGNTRPSLRPPSGPAALLPSGISWLRRSLAARSGAGYRPLLVTVFGAFLRFYRLGVPKAVIFDETYYVGDAYGILRHGVEINHKSNANALLAHGKTNILAEPAGELVVPRRLERSAIAVGNGCSA